MKKYLPLVLAAPALFLLSGCAAEVERQRIVSEEKRSLATQPFLNGSNFTTILFLVILGVILVVGAICASIAYVRVNRNRDRLRLEIEQEKTKRQLLQSGIPTPDVLENQVVNGER